MLAIAAVIACSLAALDAAALVDLVGERVVVAVVIAVQLSRLAATGQGVGAGSHCLGGLATFIA